jgi:hypothetical protein
VGLLILRYSARSKHWARPFKVWIPVAIFYLVAQSFLMVAPFLRPPGGIGDTPPLPYWLYAVVGIAVLVISVLYWAVVFWLAPLIGRYQLVPQHEVLKDGTRVVVYGRVKQL